MKNSAVTNGTLVVLDGFTNSDPEISCGSSRFWMPETGQNYQTRTSILLAAYLSSTAVNMSYYVCGSDLIKISSVQVEK